MTVTAAVQEPGRAEWGIQLVGPYFEAALTYRGADWAGVIPVGRSGTVPRGATGRSGRDPSDDEIVDWMNERGADDLGLRMPADVIGVDVDAYDGKQGAETLAALEAEHGPLPETITSSARDDGVSGIRFFRVPPGRQWRDPGGGIEVISRTHRYAKVWPSVHRKTDDDRLYRWRGREDGDVPAPGEAAELPPSWVEALSSPEAPPVRNSPSAAVRQVDETALTAEVEKYADRVVQDGAPRNNTWFECCLQLRDNGLAADDRGTVAKVVELFFALIGSHATDPNRGEPFTRRAALRTLESAFTQEAREPSRADFDVELDTSGAADDDVASARAVVRASGDEHVIPDEFWNARPQHEHVRQAAWSRGQSAESVLGAVLARIAATSPHRIKLPAIVGGASGLSVLVALVGGPGSGKSSSNRIATDLVTGHLLDEETDRVQLGSGEGLVEVLFESVKDGKSFKKVQTRFNAHVWIDEVDTLFKKRQGDIVLPTLRSIFSDEPLGQANASSDRTRRVPAGRYAYGIACGVQPERAVPLLEDVGAGTPQRFLWLSAETWVPAPGDGRPEWPGKRDRPNVVDERPLEVDGVVRREIEQRHYAARSTTIDELDAHQDLIRLKVAGLLAVWDGRRDVTAEDWRLAALVCEVSRATRKHVVDVVARTGREAVRRAGRAEGYKSAIAEQARDETLEKSKEEIVKTNCPKVINVLEQRGGWVTWRELRDRFTGARRDNLRESVELLLASGAIESRPSGKRGKKPDLRKVDR